MKIHRNSKAGATFQPSGHFTLGFLEDHGSLGSQERRIVISGLPTIQELSLVAGRIQKPRAAISKDRQSLRHWTASQANPLTMLRIATPSDAI